MRYNVDIDSLLETALWSTTDNDDMLDARFSISDVSDSFKEQCQSVMDDFMVKASHLFTEDELNESPIEHDLWLTIHGHGAGFWDGDYDQGDALTAIANAIPGLEDDLVSDLSNVVR